MQEPPQSGQNAAAVAKFYAGECMESADLVRMTGSRLSATEIVKLKHWGKQNVSCDAGAQLVLYV